MTIPATVALDPVFVAIEPHLVLVLATIFKPLIVTAMLIFIPAALLGLLIPFMAFVVAMIPPLCVNGLGD